MGYSCTKAADDTLAMIREAFASKSNDWYEKERHYFYEIGKENRDGAITGAVWTMEGYKKGGFRIEPDGTISRFDHLPASVKKEVERQRRARVPY